jgi:hypothetical protein
VVIETSHYYGNPKTREKLALADLFHKYLGDYMIERRSRLDVTVGDMVNADKRVLVAFSSSLLSRRLKLWNAKLFHGSYANKCDPQSMIAHNERAIGHAKAKRDRLLKL